MRVKVIEMLEDYTQLKRKIALLKFEQTHPIKVLSAGTVENLALTYLFSKKIWQPLSALDDTVQATSPSQKNSKLWSDSGDQIAKELYVLEEQLARLEFYVSQLDERLAAVLRGYYFERRTWRALQDVLQLSTRTLIKRRNEGIDMLAAMYTYLDQVSQTKCEYDHINHNK